MVSELHKNQQGFGVVELLLIGLVVVVWVSLGYVAYRSQTKATTSSATNIHATRGYYNPANLPMSQQQNTATTNSEQTNQTTTQSATSCHTTSYLTIKEWGVKFELPCNLTSMDYEIHGNWAYLGSPQLEALESTCSAQEKALGALIRDTDKSIFNSAQKPVKIGNYYYDYANPQAGCGYNMDAVNMQDTAMGELRLTLIPQTLTTASN